MNAVGKVALGSLGLGATGLGYRVVTTLTDNKKGSLTNRADCASEKIKNDASLVTKVAVPTAAIVAAEKIKPGLLGKIGTKAVEYLGKGATWVAAKLPKAGVLTKAANAIKANPAKFGKIGLLVGAAAYALSAITKHARNDGKIDQKYNDTGAIENATKNLVLNA